MSNRGWAARLAATALVLTGAMAILAPGLAVAQDEAPTATYEVVVGAGKSQVIQLPTAYSDVMIADPKIADILPLNTHSVYVVGKTLGATALTIYGPGKRLIAAVNVVVSPDLESFKARLHEVLPGERDVAARAANQSIILSGTASSPAVMGQIATLADTYAPGKVVNMMSVEGVQQVNLTVRFVEMERTTSKNLRLNVQGATGPLDAAGHHEFTLTTGDTLVANAGKLVNSFGAAGLGFTGAAGDLNILFDALEQKGLIKTLAEPNLTAMSGDTANFLAGGEFPIPIASTSATGSGGAPTITVEFKQFGIGLAFTPTILKDGLINMVVNPEVSAIDPTTSVNTGIVSVPGLKVRRAHTTVELRDGESFTIAGLLKDDYQNSISQFPFAGDLPILGALFRSTGYQHDQTELVIVVTPHLVTPRRAYAAAPSDHFVPPSDFELFLMGQQRGSGAVIAPEDRVLMQADPTKGGIDGPHGHVLY
ncbi:type II and III secretion system protein family protein [Caulobacter sp. KR2-114]|uniref:type II and III secretion system protein family protein n=1 Tax=Caulobacter sp. KR2-114 TaxID=3400912 RepID=UPI003C11FA26